MSPKGLRRKHRQLMPENAVPPIDPDLTLPSGGRESTLEYELLSSEANMRKLARREIGQRYWIKWIAFSLGLITMCFMGGLLWHALHQVFSSPLNLVLLSPAFLVAIVTAPILSITTIVGAVFVGAFRKEDDGARGASLAERASGAVENFSGQ